MVTQPVTIEVPQAVLDLLGQRARQAQRTVQEELVELVSSRLMDDNAALESIEDALEGLEALGDKELWQTAGMTFPRDISERTADLNYKQQRQGLTPAEREELKVMLDQYDRHVLIRAKAMALLKQRGHDISSLLVPPPGT
jgi:hypothetical protein